MSKKLDKTAQKEYSSIQDSLSFQPRLWWGKWVTILGECVHTCAHILSALLNVFKSSRPKGREGTAMNEIGTSGATSRGIWTKIKNAALNVRAAFVLAGVAISVLLSACGGGDEFAKVPLQPSAAATKSAAEGNPFAQAVVTESTSPDVRRMKALAVATPTASPYGEASPEDAASQLLDFAEKNYSQFFPSKKETLTWWKYTYRYYPETGTYVGVATGVTQGDNLSEGGVYVMGGPFGNAPTYVGQLNQFITPYKVLRYGELLISYWGATTGWPQKTMPDGTQVVANNKTRYSSFLDCWPAEKASTDGTIPHTCLAQFGNERYYDIVLDPITMELKNSPNVPSGVTYVKLTYDQSRIPSEHPTWRTAARYENGDYAFVDRASNSVIRRLSGGIEAVIYAGTFEKDRSCGLVMIFSNK